MMMNKKRQGSLVIIVLILALISSMSVNAFIKAKQDIDRSNRVIENTTDLYNNIALNTIVADAFFSDLGAWWERSAPLGELTKPKWEIYEELLNTINATYFTDAGDGTWRYKGANADKIVQFIEYDPLTSGPMENQLKLQNKIVTGVDVVVDNVFEIGATAPVFDEGALLSGTPVILKDITFTVTVSEGLHRIERSYKISGLQALFTDTTSGIRCSIRLDDAKITKVKQFTT